MTTPMFSLDLAGVGVLFHKGQTGTHKCVVIYCGEGEVQVTRTYIPYTGTHTRAKA